jgi:hypothetical protein
VGQHRLAGPRRAEILTMRTLRAVLLLAALAISASAVYAQQSQQ